ncbi:hypothetical protein BKA66DRAFT_450322 [Pyrenochaeta sp. MPI-SDFR-AT-0127]|nr:hypothetical protein BKA66DRAFT_450322 [Pyrenochaeta sp. MPI-SDFR-AT-0127]
MAATEGRSHIEPISTTSHDTALCIIPPFSHRGHIDRLRELYDKAYGRWPPHVNLIYPFVAPESLSRAQQQIQQYLDERVDMREPMIVKLGQTGHFEQRSNSTIFLRENESASTSSLESLRTMVLQALGQTCPSSTLHLTVGQSEDNTESARMYLLAKTQLLPALQFQVGALAILIRERASGFSSIQPMRLWGIVDICPSQTAWKPQLPEYWIHSPALNSSSLRAEASDDEDEPDLRECKAFSREVQPGITFYFNSEQNSWSACTEEEPNDVEATTVTVSSYNVLIDSEYPPARDRDPLLVRTILLDSAMADILVLQEVSDDFLSYLLSDSEVQRRYPFTSHAPPSQPEIGPLPSLRNVVILSSFNFSWKLVPFHRRHKGALVAHFGGITRSSASGLGDLVVAGVHLTCGLTDGSVAAKKVQLANLTGYLERHHSTEPWVIAGDFNITTSTYTIETALKNKSISSQTVATLSLIESAISDAGLLDSWSVARIEAVDMSDAQEPEYLFEGEEGATFDPRNNALAAVTSGTSNNRAQRYDRILLRPQDTLRVVHFNHFGLPEDVDGTQVVASDHCGVRTTFRVLDGTTESATDNQDAAMQPKVEHIKASTGLLDLSTLTRTLVSHGMFPSDEESSQRQIAFALLRQVVLNASDDDHSTFSEIPLVIVPVGSFALGVWTSESDIDCLCIGTISSKTFFKLARQRLLKAESQGVRILRKVEANTGTMLEISVHGIPMDLQYCPATRVIERWTEFRNLSADDPIFNMSMLSLRKLKPYRDLLYVQRTVPSLSTYRLAYRCIKLWAIQRGIYSSKFGYLGGIHITLMLSWVCKRISHDSGLVSAADLIASFFHHYARFAWATDMVYDAFFNKNKPRYHRSAREPMVILGFHAPNSNVAHTATLPGLQTLLKEFKIAEERLSEPSITWESFFAAPDHSTTVLGLPHGAADFLRTHGNYIKIDINFWGRTLAKGKSLVGWVESRCLSLVVDIHKALPDLNVRIWPARFTDSDTIGSPNNNDYHGCYLIGLSRDASHATPNSKNDKQLERQLLGKVLDKFLNQLRTDEKNYDASTCWIDVSLARSSEVKHFNLDNREWGDYAVESDSDDEEDADDDFDEVDTTPVQRVIPQRPKPTSIPLSTAKLRPASDVLNRLRWDPSLDPTDYIIGYEDRFLGARETSLEKWKTEQTDEEFIPQHRILYFKKRGGADARGEVVWERATRIDRVFGSGVGNGNGH